MSLFLIDIGRPVLFVHITKCGGTSIREGRDIGGGYRIYSPDPLWPKDVPSFAFVRDPFERVVSCWRDWRYNRHLIIMGFDQFVDAFVGDTQGLDNPATIQHHLAPMTHPMHGLPHAKFVGKFKSLQSDFDEFCNESDIPQYTLPHLRQSAQHGGAMVSAASMDEIKSVYSDDYAYVN